jgi:hypothetical protein
MVPLFVILSNLKTYRFAISTAFVVACFTATILDFPRLLFLLDVAAVASNTCLARVVLDFPRLLFLLDVAAVASNTCLARVVSLVSININSSTV